MKGKNVWEFTHCLNLSVINTWLNLRLDYILFSQVEMNRREQPPSKDIRADETLVVTELSCEREPEDLENFKIKLT